MYKKTVEKLMFLRAPFSYVVILFSLIFLITYKLIFRNRIFIIGYLSDEGLDIIPQLMNLYYLLHNFKIREPKSEFNFYCISAKDIDKKLVNEAFSDYLLKFIFDKYDIKKSNIPLIFKAFLTRLGFVPYLRGLGLFISINNIVYSNWDLVYQNFITNSSFKDKIYKDLEILKTEKIFPKRSWLFHARTDRFKKLNKTFDRHPNQEYRNSRYESFNLSFKYAEKNGIFPIILGADNHECKYFPSSLDFFNSYFPDSKYSLVFADLYCNYISEFWIIGSTGARWFSHLLDKPGVFHNCIPFNFEIATVLPKNTLIIPKKLYKYNKQITLFDQWKLDGYNYNEQGYLLNLKSKNITKIEDVSEIELLFSILYFEELYFKKNDEFYRIICDINRLIYMSFATQSEAEILMRRNIFISPFEFLNKDNFDSSFWEKHILKNIQILNKIDEIRNIFFKIINIKL